MIDGPRTFKQNQFSAYWTDQKSHRNIRFLIILKLIININIDKKIDTETRDQRENCLEKDYGSWIINRERYKKNATTGHILNKNISWTPSSKDASNSRDSYKERKIQDWSLSFTQLTRVRKQHHSLTNESCKIQTFKVPET